VIDQYRFTRNEQGRMANDPNRPDNSEYIFRLLNQVITVSLQTMNVVNGLPPLNKKCRLRVNRFLSASRIVYPQFTCRF